MTKSNTVRQLPALALLLGLIISGCSTEEMMPLHTTSSGSSTVEILTPGGRLKSGNNPILIRAATAGDAVTVSDAELMFSMPAMGGMPYMELQTVFPQSGSNDGLAGNLKFTMGGSWTGHLHVMLGDTPVSATFPMRVDD